MDGTARLSVDRLPLVPQPWDQGWTAASGKGDPSFLALP